MADRGHVPALLHEEVGPSGGQTGGEGTLAVTGTSSSSEGPDFYSTLSDVIQ